MNRSSRKQTRFFFLPISLVYLSRRSLLHSKIFLTGLHSHVSQLTCVCASIDFTGSQSCSHNTSPLADPETASPARAARALPCSLFQTKAVKLIFVNIQHTHSAFV